MFHLRKRYERFNLDHVNRLQNVYNKSMDGLQKEQLKRKSKLDDEILGKLPYPVPQHGRVYANHTFRTDKKVMHG